MSNAVESTGEIVAVAATRPDLLSAAPVADEKKREYQRKWRAANPEKVRGYTRARYAAHGEKIREETRAWREANPERHLEHNRAWYAANTERYLERQRAWREANRERVREINRQSHAAAYAANPERFRARNHQRRARKAGVPSEPWTTWDILERDGWRCQLEDCRRPEDRTIDPAEPFGQWSGTADHIHPLSKGGSDLKSNIQAAHHSCNSAKHDRWDGS